MNMPLCDIDPAHGFMKHVIITQGDVVLGCAFFCVRDDQSQPDYCEGCIDCDCVDKDKVSQLSLFGVEQA